MRKLNYTFLKLLIVFFINCGNDTIIEYISPSMNHIITSKDVEGIENSTGNIDEYLKLGKYSVIYVDYKIDCIGLTNQYSEEQVIEWEERLTQTFYNSSDTTSEWLFEAIDNGKVNLIIPNNEIIGCSWLPDIKALGSINKDKEFMVAYSETDTIFDDEYDGCFEVISGKFDQNFKKFTGKYRQTSGEGLSEEYLYYYCNTEIGVEGSFAE